MIEHSIDLIDRIENIELIEEKQKTNLIENIEKNIAENPVSVILE